MPRNTPPLEMVVSYETATSLQHIMLAAYEGLKRHDLKSYEQTMSQTKRFFDHLTKYLETNERK